MKHCFGILLLILISSTLLFSQEEQQEEEILPPKRSAAAKIGAAGGFTSSLLFFDAAPLNEILRNTTSAEIESKFIPLYGGQGYGYIMFVKNLRLGGMGMSGTVKTKSLSGSTRRDVELTVGYGGVTVEYVVPLFSRLDITAGILLGGGGMDIKITRDEGMPKIWDDLWNEFGPNGSPVNEYSRTLSGSFFIYQPSLNLEFAILRWLGVRAGVAYLGMGSGSWRLDDKYDVYGVPSSIHGKGWMINGGVFLGTFVY
jgi:hypothetical protein